MTLTPLVNPTHVFPPPGPPGTQVAPPRPASATYRRPSSPIAIPRGLSNPLATVVNAGFGEAEAAVAVTPIVEPNKPVSAIPSGIARRHARIILCPFPDRIASRSRRARRDFACAHRPFLRRSGRYRTGAKAAMIDTRLRTTRPPPRRTSVAPQMRLPTLVGLSDRSVERASASAGHASPIRTAA